MIETITKHGGRHYVIYEGKERLELPSVTTVIGFMSDDTWLEAWKNRIGHEKAAAISKFSANRGTMMHLFCENFLDSKLETKKERLKESLIKTTEWGKENKFTDAEIDVGRGLFFNFYTHGNFDRIKRVVMQEKRLHSKLGGGYAGRVDLIYENFDGKIIIEDFKSSKKPKRTDWIENYKLQTAAYVIAFWELTNITPSHGEIWISNEQNNIPQIFTMDMKEIKTYYGRFIEGVKDYHKYHQDITIEDLLK